MDQTTSNSSSKSTIPKDEAFKVIIIGGGVGGLTLAHCLDRAGIDYIVLDKHPIAPAWGASITIHPSSSRILDQLGLLDDLDEICTPMYNFWNRTPGGKEYLSGAFFDGIRKRAGYLTYTLERRRFLQLLYDRLPGGETKVVPNGRVVSINLIPSTTSGGGITKVQAILSNGTSHTGDLVVGADGVYSTVRSQLWSLADQLSESNTTGVTNPIRQRDREPRIKTAYYGLTGISPMTPGFKVALGDRDMTSVSGSQVVRADGKKIEPYSMLFLTQPDMVYWIVHFKIPQQPANTEDSEHERRKFTERDADLVARRFVAGKIASHSSITFKDIWDSRLRGHLVPLQEGFFPNLYAPGCRIALLGDAAHKVTPNAAWGGNMAIEDAVVLANELVQMVHSIHHGSDVEKYPRPDGRDIDLALGRYENERVGRVKEIVWMSGLLTSLQAWDGWGMWFLQRWLVPLIGIDIIASQIAKTCVEAPKLTFFTERVLDHGNTKTGGTLKWRYHGLDSEEDQEMLTNTRKGFVGQLPKGKSLYWGPVLGVIMSIMVVYVAMI